MTATAVPASRIDALLSRLDSVQSQGRGYRARCPSCGGRSRKLSISEGDEGRVLLHCFGGCTPADVIQAMGLTLGDLFPTRLRPETPEERRAWRRAARESQWGAALEVLDYEATLLVIGIRAVLAGEHLAPDDTARLELAAERITEARGIFRGR